MTGSNINKVQSMKRSKQQRIETEQYQLTQSRAAKRKSEKLKKLQARANKEANKSISTN